MVNSIMCYLPSDKLQLAKKHGIPIFQKALRPLPFGILNLSSFLNQRQPCCVLTILTGYSVSGQSATFRAKSVANKKRNQTKTRS